MSEPNRPPYDLPEALRDPNRAVIVYQTSVPAQEVTGNPLYLLGWLATVSVCVIVLAISLWRIWNPEHNAQAFSLIYAEGRPVGLAGRIEERERINQLGQGLPDFLERVRSDTLNEAPTFAEHPIITGRNGVDALRQEWDAECRRIRDTVYERRIGQLDVQITELRRVRGLGGPPEERARIDSELAVLAARRAVELENRRTDGDPTLRCTPAAVAPVCAPTAPEPWCNPQVRQASEFRNVPTVLP